MSKATLADFMTAKPMSFPSDASIAAARRAMEQFQIRHLLVRKDEQIVGVISDRELSVLEAMDEIVNDQAPARLAMTPDPYRVPLSEPLASVAAQMANQGIGSVLVVDDDLVVGIFTTTDALRALERLA